MDELLAFDDAGLQDVVRRAVPDVGSHLPEIGELLLTSIDENFQVGGRYMSIGNGEFTGGTQKWVPTKATKEETPGGRDSSGRFRKRSGGLTLVDSGLLAKSISYAVEGDGLVLRAGMVYSAIHQFGGDIQHPGGTPYIIVGGRAQFVSKAKVAAMSESERADVKYTKPHVIHIDARPYLVIQDEDIEAIGEILLGSA
jgi:phage gpG-like protein